jgi:hypothetical protein
VVCIPDTAIIFEKKNAQHFGLNNLLLLDYTIHTMLPTYRLQEAFHHAHGLLPR